jgi:hypothetical protein
VIDLEAGLACAGFELRIEIWNNPNRVFKEFKDKNGNVVRMLTAGKGNTLAFTNLLTNEKLSLKPNGAVEHIALNPDGSQTWVITLIAISNTSTPVHADQAIQRPLSWSQLFNQQHA